MPLRKPYFQINEKCRYYEWPETESKYDLVKIISCESFNKTYCYEIVFINDDYDETVEVLELNLKKHYQTAEDYFDEK